MISLPRIPQAFLDDEDGAAVIEYAVLIALIIAAVIFIIITLGGQIQQGFQSFSEQLTSLGITAT